MTTKPRQTHIQQLKAKCGVYATAKHLNRKGYTLNQALVLLFPQPKAERSN